MSLQIPGGVLACFLFSLWVCAPVRAEELAATADSPWQRAARAEALEPHYRASLRAMAGLGLGRPGFGGRASAGGEYWLGETLGLGIDAGFFGQGAIFGAETSAGFVTAVAALRSAARRSYFVGALGAGYARVERENDEGLCLFSCPPASITRYHGVMIGGTIGWLAHPGGSWFEMAPVAKLDIVADPSDDAPIDFLVTVNLAVGYAWLR